MLVVRAGLFDFFAPNAIKIVGEQILGFMCLAVGPLYLIFWLKKMHQPSPLVSLLNQCIRHGQILRSDDCSKINYYIKEIKANLEAFAKNESPSPDIQVSLAQAIEALPLIYEISRPKTGCEQPLNELDYRVGFDCKSSLRTLLLELEKTPNLPFISEELHQIQQVRQAMKASKSRRRPLVFLLTLLYSYTVILLSQTILFNRTTWKIELGIYLGCLALFFWNYDYCYLKEFSRYQKRPKRRKVK